MKPSALLATALSLAALLGACDSQGGGEPTMSTCPQGSTLTYDNFARAFMESYCTRCHSSTLTGDARMGAPAFHDFDSEQGILNVADHVDEYAAAGPTVINRVMPPSGATPSDAERRQLGEWLACRSQ